MDRQLTSLRDDGNYMGWKKAAVAGQPPDIPDKKGVLHFQVDQPDSTGNARVPRYSKLRSRQWTHVPLNQPDVHNCCGDALASSV